MPDQVGSSSSSATEVRLRRLARAYERPLRRSVQVARPYAVACSSTSSWSAENTRGAAGSVTSVSGPPGRDGSMRWIRSRSWPRSEVTATSAVPPGDSRSPCTRSTLLKRPGAWSGPGAAGAGSDCTRRASRSWTRSPPSLAVAITRLWSGSAGLRQIAGSSALALPPSSSSYSVAVSARGVTAGSVRGRSCREVGVAGAGAAATSVASAAQTASVAAAVGRAVRKGVTEELLAVEGRRSGAGERGGAGPRAAGAGTGPGRAEASEGDPRRPEACEGVRQRVRRRVRGRPKAGRARWTSGDVVTTHCGATGELPAAEGSTAPARSRCGAKTMEAAGNPAVEEMISVKLMCAGSRSS